MSEISLGSWLTFAGGVPAEQTRACTEAAFDAGINFFDTANAYGQGAAESACAPGVALTGDALAVIDAALGNAPVKAPALALFAQEGVLHRSSPRS